MQNYEEYTLNSGLKIVTETLPYVNSATIGVWLGTGSRDETAVNNGISHFIEHLMFKGTKKRTAREIAETIDSVGGQINAFTSKDHTCYYIRILDKYLPLAMDVLSDMLNDSLLDPEEIEKEKKVIIEEIRMYEDSPDELVHDLFAQSIWGKHPLGQSIAGEEEVIRNLTRQDIIDYIGNHYVSKNTVISVAGNLTHSDVIQDIERMFPPKPLTPPRRLEDLPGIERPVYIKEKKTEQVHLCLGTRAYSRDHQDRYALTVLDSILGGGVSSRLFQRVREEKGLVYSVYSYYTSYNDTGAFAVYAGTSPENIEEVVEIVTEELFNVKREGVTRQELIRTKEQLKGNLMLSLESTSNRMSRLGKSELFFQRIIPIEEVVKNIDKVQLEDVKRVALELFRRDNLVLTAIGPIDDKIANKIRLDE